MQFVNWPMILSDINDDNLHAPMLKSIASITYTYLSRATAGRFIPLWLARIKTDRSTLAKQQFMLV